MLCSWCWEAPSDRRRNIAFLLLDVTSSVHPSWKFAVASAPATACTRPNTIGRTISDRLLRRTGARMMYLAGVDIEDISATLGHAETKTTMLYLGLTVEDLRQARERTSDYLDAVRERMRTMPQPVIEIQRPALFRR